MLRSLLIKSTPYFQIWARVHSKLIRFLPPQLPLSLRLTCNPISNHAISWGIRSERSFIATQLAQFIIHLPFVKFAPSAPASPPSYITPRATPASATTTFSGIETAWPQERLPKPASQRERNCVSPPKLTLVNRTEIFWVISGFCTVSFVIYIQTQLSVSAESH